MRSSRPLPTGRNAVLMWSSGIGTQYPPAQAVILPVTRLSYQARNVARIREIADLLACVDVDQDGHWITFYFLTRPFIAFLERQSESNLQQTRPLLTVDHQ